MKNIYEIILIVILHSTLIIYSLLGIRALTFAKRLLIGMVVLPFTLFVLVYLSIWLQHKELVANASKIIEHIKFLLLYLPVIAHYYAIKRKKGTKRGQ